MTYIDTNINCSFRKHCCFDNIQVTITNLLNDISYFFNFDDFPLVSHSQRLRTRGLVQQYKVLCIPIRSKLRFKTTQKRQHQHCIAPTLPHPTYHSIITLTFSRLLDSVDINHLIHPHYLMIRCNSNNAHISLHQLLRFRLYRVDILHLVPLQLIQLEIR